MEIKMKQKCEKIIKKIDINLLEKFTLDGTTNQIAIKSFGNFNIVAKFCLHF